MTGRDEESEDSELSESEAYCIESVSRRTSFVANDGRRAGHANGAGTSRDAAANNNVVLTSRQRMATMTTTAVTAIGDFQRPAPDLLRIKQKTLSVSHSLTEQAKKIQRDTTFNFVSIDGVQSHMLKKAIGVLEVVNCGFKIKWIDEAVLTTRIERSSGQIPPGVFVLEDATSKLCRLLMEKQCRVFGPMALIQTQGREHLPNRPVAVMSLYMYGKNVSISGITNPNKDKLVRKIEFMGGRVMPYTTMVNCLIASQQGSDKCRLARKRGTPIYTPELVETCWQKTCDGQFSTPERLFAAHRLPIFHGFTLTVSQVSRVKCYRTLSV